MMQRASFSLNSKFRWHEKIFAIQQISNQDQVLLKSETGNFRTTTINDLLSSYNDGEINFNIKNILPTRNETSLHTVTAGRQLNDFSEATQKHSLRFHKYIKRLLQDGPISIDRAGIIDEKIAAIAAQLDDANPPHRTTIFRWYKKYLASSCDRLAAIYQFENRGGKNQARASKEEIEIQDKLIEELYLKERGASVEDLVMQMDLICRKENQWRIDGNKLRSRSRSSFMRRIKQIDPFEVMAARAGLAEARLRFCFNGKVPKTFRPLEIVEIDHTPIDYFVINLVKGIPLGRPTLTMACCRDTKMPWGLHIGFDDCSTEAVIACIENGVKPKTYVRELFPKIQGNWPVFGIPAELRCDNGQEFHSTTLKIIAEEMGFELAYCPKKQPNWKGSIESFLKTFNYQFIHKLPGTTLAKYYKRKDYDPLKAAVIDFNELNRLVHLWLIDIYMNSFHRGLGCTPIEAWRRDAE
ncbi:DDE-type integrase/transposase/recombinase [Undibacterium curvum]|uniref:DDE-type integrase/transposase/recombinase n=1 Tax=Undibacterium curvum TaxID=2762294 RepID=A0ABR7A6T6_9BURK|nr:DDE-type integrase/transposase/recombinase [Undibacterium curvum]MBC3932611.1 DDE-type integrase/transposase/recombinase [Undibacterium curvum]